MNRGMVTCAVVGILLFWAIMSWYMPTEKQDGFVFLLIVTLLVWLGFGAFSIKEKYRPKIRDGETVRVLNIYSLQDSDVTEYYLIVKREDGRITTINRDRLGGHKPKVVVGDAIFKKRYGLILERTQTVATAAPAGQPPADDSAVVQVDPAEDKGPGAGAPESVAEVT